MAINHEWSRFMRAMDIVTAMKSGAFDARPCGCGKWKGRDHVNLVSKTTLLMDVRDPAIQSLCSMTATYVKIVITYHCDLFSRTVLASAEIRNPSGDLVLRSEGRWLPKVLVPSTEAGEEELFALLRVQSTLLEAAKRRRAA